MQSNIYPAMLLSSEWGGGGREIVWPVTATATAMVIHPHHCCGGHRGSAGLFSSVSPSLYDYVMRGGGGGPSESSRLRQTGDCSFSLIGLFYCKVAHNPPNRLTQDDVTALPGYTMYNSHLAVIFCACDFLIFIRLFSLLFSAKHIPAIATCLEDGMKRQKPPP